MIQCKPRNTEISYRSFLKELGTMLAGFGVAPARRLITAEADRNQNRSGSNPDPETTVGRIVIYIEEHLAEQLSLERMAEEARLSKFQLIRRFRDELGSTPWKYLVGKRVEKAKELLEQGVPPGQTAVETGFYDQSHMHRAFREETGQTPKAYQEENFKNCN